MRKRLGRLFGRKPHAVISFPKSGRTWLRVMLDDLGIPAKYTHAGANHTFGHHWSELDTSQADEYRRIVFLHRDPRDTAVSGYFQVDRRRGGYDGSLSDFLRDPCHGVEKITRYNAMWLDLAAKHETILAIAYEDLHDDAVAILRRVTAFLGRAATEKQVRAVVDDSSFERMQERERSGVYAEKYGAKLAPADPSDTESYKVRRGKVGGYRDYLSPVDLEYCEQVLARLLRPCRTDNSGDITAGP